MHNHHDPIAAGASSFDLVNVDRLFRLLDLAPGSTFLDLACGRGSYAFEAASRVGTDGVVWAVDLWEEGIRFVEARAAEEGAGNVRPLLADVSRHIPLPDGAVDLCLMAAVLHDLIQDGTDRGTLGEVRRCVKRGGILAVVEFRVADGPPGPPRKVRIDPRQVTSLAGTFGFAPRGTHDLGEHAYLCLFRAEGA